MGSVNEMKAQEALHSNTLAEPIPIIVMRSLIGWAHIQNDPCMKLAVKILLL